MIRGYAWLHNQESLMAVLEEPNGRPRIEPESVTCRANTLLSELYTMTPIVALLEPESQVPLGACRKDGEMQKMRVVLDICTQPFT